MCEYFHCATTVVVTADAVQISFAQPITATDKDRFCFKLCQSIPTAGAALPVQVEIAGIFVPLWNKYGNPILGSQLRRRKYCGYYGATTPHVILTNTPMVCGCERTVY